MVITRIVAGLLLGALSTQPQAARAAGAQSSAATDAAGDELPGEAIYPLVSRDMWRHVRDLVRDLELGSSHVDNAHQVIVTEWKPYDGLSLPDASALGLPASLRPVAIQFHVFVAPGIEPARVAVGSILRAENPAARQMNPRLRYPSAGIYSHPLLTVWLIERLSALAGATPEPLGRLPERRAAQALRLMPAGTVDRCATTPARLITAAQLREPGNRAPSTVHQVRPMYPGPEFTARAQGGAIVQAELTEHGTVVDARPAKPIGAGDNFAAVTRFVAQLWRFKPGVSGECAARTDITIQLTFSTR